LTLTLALTLLFLERKLDRVYSGSYTPGDAAGGRKKKGGLGGISAMDISIYMALI
jgi:hypothetical protein